VKSYQAKKLLTKNEAYSTIKILKSPATPKGLRRIFLKKIYNDFMKKKTIILIDGSNFYFKLKNLRLHHLINFNFSEFCKKLVLHNQITKIVYYVGKVRTDGTERKSFLIIKEGCYHISENIKSDIL